jgi:hypothetical protein
MKGRKGDWWLLLRDVCIGIWWDEDGERGGIDLVAVRWIS